MNRVYFSQVDNRWKNNSYPSPSLPNATIGSGGCGVCAASMVVSSMKETVTPDKMAVDFINNGLRVNGGTSNLAMDWIADKYEIKHELKWKLDEAMDCLKKGGMVIALCKSGLWTTGGHFIVLAGLKDMNTIIVFDSYLYTNKFNLYGRNGKVELDGTSAYVSYDNMKEYGAYKQLWCYYPDEEVQEEYSQYNISTPQSSTKTMKVFNVSTNLNVRNQPNGSIVGKLKNGTVVTVYEESNGWSRIGNGEWVSSSYLTSNVSNTNITNTTLKKYCLGKYVTRTNLNVRTGAGTNNSIKKTYKKSTRFDTYEIQGSWARTPSGWVCLDYCSLVYKY